MGLLAVVPRASEGSQEFSGADFVEDFEFLWDSFSREYAYFDDVPVDWQKVRQHYFRQVETAATLDAFMTVVEQVLEELCDNHVHLTTNTSTSPRIVPARSDLHARWQEGRAVIRAVRAGFAADGSGLLPGDIVIDLDETPIEELADSRLPVAAVEITPEMRNWALNRVLAGHRGVDRHIRFQRGTQELVVTVEAGTFDRIYSRQHATQLDSKWLPDRVGYIRFNDSLGDDSVVGVFDLTLEEFGAAAGIIKEGAFQPISRTGYVPDVRVDPTLGGENRGDTDRILEAGLRVLQTEISRVRG